MFVHPKSEETPMKTETESIPAEASTPPTTAVVKGQPRLWPGLVLVVLFWAAFFVMGAVEKPYFVQFLYNMAAPAALLLLFSIWWWCNRRMPLTDRVYGCLLVIATGAAVALFCHRSVWFGLPTLGLPVALTVLALWMLVVQWTGFPWKRLGLLVALALSWGYFGLIRIDGLNADLQSTTTWRWTPTAEEEFLAEKTRETSATAPASSLLAPAVPGLQAGDWPTFRGPNRDGVIPDITIPTDWNTSPPKMLWRRRVGPAWSSVIVIGDRLFTQEQRGEQETVVCYEASTGKEVWVHADTARFEGPPAGPGPRATPTFSGGRLFTLGASGIFNCLDAATGERYWSHHVTADAPAKPPMWGYSSSPLVVDDKVIVFAGGEGDRNLLAYRADTGAPVWAAAASHDSYSSPELVTLGGQRQCLLLGDQGLTAVDPAKGRVLWQYGWVQAGAPRTLQAHVLGSSQVVAGTLSGPGVGLVDVTHDGDQWQVTEVWSTTAMNPEFPDFVVHAGHAYGFDGAIFCCLDLVSGNRRWKGGRYGRGQVMLLPEQSVLLVISEKGEAILVAADPERHRELGRFRALAGKTWNHPVISGGRLYLRNDEEMACYELVRFAEKGQKPDGK
jgi:outer membrane protein assembly factor BamB